MLQLLCKIIIAAPHNQSSLASIHVQGDVGIVAYLQKLTWLSFAQFLNSSKPIPELVQPWASRQGCCCCEACICTSRRASCQCA